MKDRGRKFLCEEGGKVVGTITAFSHPHDSELGMVGCFDCVDSVDVAARLLRDAGGWLRSLGVRRVVGPMDGGAHRTYRCMTRGFEERPFLFEPRNPPYYPRLFTANGFELLRTWYSFTFLADLLRDSWERLGMSRIAARAGRRYRIEFPDPRDGRTTLARIAPLLDRVWGHRVGYYSLSPQELSDLSGGLFSLMSVGCLGVAVDENGKDVGFAYQVPDGARMVMHTVAVLPEVERRGVPFLLFQTGLFEALKRGHSEIVVALVHEQEKFFRRIAEPTREYRLYVRSL